MQQDRRNSFLAETTTTYLQDAIDAEQAEGRLRSIHDDTIAHLSPARFEQINPYGQYRFDITNTRQRHPLRPSEV